MPRPSSSISTTTRSRCAAHADTSTRPLRALARRGALLGRLDAVVDAVAQEVQQRVRELVEDGAVELDLRAGDRPGPRRGRACGRCRAPRAGSRSVMTESGVIRARHHLVVQVLHQRVQPVDALVERRPRALGQRLAHLAQPRGGEQQLAHRVEEVVEQLGPHPHRARGVRLARRPGRPRRGRGFGARAAAGRRRRSGTGCERDQLHLGDVPQRLRDAALARRRSPARARSARPGCGPPSGPPARACRSNTLPSAESRLCTRNARTPGTWQVGAMRSFTAKRGGSPEALARRARPRRAGSAARRSAPEPRVRRRCALGRRTTAFATRVGVGRLAGERLATCVGRAASLERARRRPMGSSVRRRAHLRQQRVGGGEQAGPPARGSSRPRSGATASTRSSTRWASVAIGSKPIDAAMPFTEWAWRNIESHRVRRRALLLELRRRSRPSASRCSVASETKSPRYLDMSIVMSRPLRPRAARRGRLSPRRAPSSPPPARPRRGTA